MSDTMAPVPVDSPLMKAWEAYKQTDDYANSLYWATTLHRMRQANAAAHGVSPEQNVASEAERQDRAQGSLWAAFARGFEAGAAQKG